MADYSRYSFWLELFPVLQGVKFTHAWGGPVGMPRDWMPMTEFNPATRIATARGYTGQGVSTTNLTGRILAEISGKRTALSQLPIAQRHSPDREARTPALVCCALHAERFFSN